MHGPDYGSGEKNVGRKLDEQVTQMPAVRAQLARFDAAETYEQHEEQQYGLCPAADCLKDGTGTVYGGNLHIYKICSGAGNHADYKHPVLQEFYESASHMVVFGFSVCEDTFYLRFTF